MRPEDVALLEQRLSIFIERLRGRLPAERMAWINDLAGNAELELAIESIQEEVDGGRLVLTDKERRELDELAVGFDVDLASLAKARRITQYDFVREPRGEQLRGLIAAGAAICDRFTFELSGMQLSSRADAVLVALEPFLMSRVETSETPGSTLLDGTITLCTYRLTYEPARILAGATDRLYDWAEPELPQDLCLLRGSQPWLITLAADRAASLIVTPGDARALSSGGLKLRPAPQVTLGVAD